MNIQSGDRELPEIFEAQDALKQLNMYFFGIDGIFGPGTAKAVASFQHQKELEVTGALDKTTYDLLIEAKNQLQQAPPLPEIEWGFIEAAYAEKGYPMHEEQYKINLLGIRRDDIFDNTFSDRLVIFWKNEKMEWEMRQFEWTTMPGTEGKGGVFNPLTVNGITGVAVLEEGHYANAWKFYDTYVGWLRYPYFQQIRTVKIKRDNTKDRMLDYEATEQSGLFGINIHRMSGNGVHQRFVNNAYVTWSLGCQGAPEPVFRDVVALARISAKFHGDIFSYTLMHANDFPALRGVGSGDYFTSLKY